MSSNGGKVKSSQGAQAKNQPQPSTSSHPQVHCSASGGKDHLRKDCHQDTYCTRCRTRSHAIEMCHAPTKTGRDNSICISTVVAKVIHQESVSTDPMTTRRSPDQHQGTSRTTEQWIQVTIIIFSIKIETLISKQGLMKGLTGNTHLIIIIISHLP